MKIAINEPAQRLLVLLNGDIRLYDLATDPASPVASYPVLDAQWLTAATDQVAVLAGDSGPAAASIPAARVVRLGWNLSELATFPVGHIELRGIALSPDGRRLALVNWGKSEVTVVEAGTGERLTGSGDGGILSGASWSPDGRLLLAGSADQGEGAILLFDAPADGDMSLDQLPKPEASPGLDDAPFFSTFAAGGALAAVSNESWGGRGLFVYEVVDRKVAWSRVFESETEESEDWHPYPVAFARNDALVLAAHPGAIHAYRSSDGTDLGGLALDTDTRAGFAVEHGRQGIWAVADDGVQAYPFPASWAA